MDRVTADANIYITAFQFRGKPLELVTLAGQRRIELAISDYIVEEVTRTLREKFEWPPEGIARIQRIMSRSAKQVAPSMALDVVKADPSDNRIIECALASWSEYIVSGDKHLVRLGQYEGIKILRVADFLREIQPGRGGSHG